MALSEDLVSQFVKNTKDKVATKSESTVYGTVRIVDKSVYVELDGSNARTPVSSTSDVSEGDRVIVLIKNHTATIIGNLSAPSAKENVVSEHSESITLLKQQVYDMTPEGVETLSGEIKTLSDSLNTVLETVESNSTSIETLTNDVNDLKIKTETIENTISNINVQITSIRNSITALTNSTTKLTEDLTSLTNRVSVLENNTTG